MKCYREDFKMSKSKKELFLELAQPDKNGVSRLGKCYRIYRKISRITAR